MYLGSPNPPPRMSLLRSFLSFAPFLSVSGQVSWPVGKRPSSQPAGLTCPVVSRNLPTASSLERVRPFSTNACFQYSGFWYPTRVDEQLVLRVRDLGAVHQVVIKLDFPLFARGDPNHARGKRPFPVETERVRRYFGTARSGRSGPRERAPAP